MGNRLLIQSVSNQTRTTFSVLNLILLLQSALNANHSALICSAKRNHLIEHEPVPVRALLNVLLH